MKTHRYEFKSRALLSTRRIKVDADDEITAAIIAARRLFPDSWDEVKLISSTLHLYEAGSNQMVLVTTVTPE
jgi:hypothetical protein